MKTVFQVRKPCPRCGREMRLVPTKAEGDQESYVCTNCDDPMRDPIARHWVESPLKPPEE
jgi:tRNA(Ile2) C34 agmatinyltransferase TiaS